MALESAATERFGELRVVDTGLNEERDGMETSV